jgi:catechol 2,3-dioxygenase-like lactoylglutathione lyase family enzyme
LLSHFTVGSTNLERSGAFYDALFIPIGLKRRVVTPDGGPLALCWVSPFQPLPRFYVYEPMDGKVASVGNGSMLAFLAPSIESVNLAYAAGMANGGTDEGLPGPRSNYGVGYFGAYLRDPDGNKIHIAHRGDLVPSF